MVRPIGAQSFMDPEVQRCPFELEASLRFELGTPNAGGHALFQTTPGDYVIAFFLNADTLP